MAQIDVKPEFIIRSLQETIASQQQQLSMMRAALLQLTEGTDEDGGYREGDDPVSDG